LEVSTKRGVREVKIKKKNFKTNAIKPQKVGPLKFSQPLYPLPKKFGENLMDPPAGFSNLVHLRCDYLKLFVLKRNGSTVLKKQAFSKYLLLHATNHFIHLNIHCRIQYDVELLSGFLFDLGN
jgi:hypothetical protein